MPAVWLVAGQEYDVLAIGCLQRDTVRAWQGCETYSGIPLDVLHPDVCEVACLKRQMLPVGRKAQISVKSLSRVQRLRLTGAIQPEDRPRRLPFPADVNKDPSLGKVEIPRAGEADVAGERLLWPAC